jgi:hypothetical protein
MAVRSADLIDAESPAGVKSNGLGSGWRPCRPLASMIVKLFTKIRDQREQTISAER